MTGLLRKDFLEIRTSLRIYLVLALVYTLFAFGTKEIIGMAAFVQFFFSTVVLNCFTYDEAVGWNRFCSATPMARRTTVTARYLFALMVALSAFGLGLLMLAISTAVHGSDGTWEQLAILAVCLAASVIMQGVSLPLCYRYGVERSRIALMIIMLLPFLVIWTISNFDLPIVQRLFGHFTVLDPTVWMGGILGGAALFAVIAFLFSWRISIRIYQHQEL